MTQNKKLIIFSLVGAVVVLWQMLLPGYVLTLDMVFGPHMVFPSLSSMATSSYPVWIILYGLNFVMSAWVVQKIILFVLFFLLFYMPARFYIFTVNGDKNSEYAGYFVALLYAINPFVYERFLAGNWLVLAGYALLPAFIYSLVSFYKEHTWHNAVMVSVWLLLVGLFSQHILVMGVLILGAFLIGLCFVFIAKKEWGSLRVFAVQSAVALLVFLAGSSYWIVPYFLNPSNSPIAIFTPAHWDAFRTAGDAQVGVVGNVLSLYGFWGERDVWNSLFVMAKSNHALWLATFAPIALLVLMGVYVGIRKRVTRMVTVFLLCTAFAATVFSSGIGDSIFKSFNLWLFEHIGFWKGFRDSQKWSAFLVLAYAMLGGLGVSLILEKLKTEKVKKYICVVLCLIPILYTPAILFGFSGQIKTVWYPDEWSEVNEVFKKDDECKALFLPWHQYYYLRFNRGMLTGNVADSYFDCTMVSGKNMELGTVASQGGNGPEYDIIEPLVIGNYLDADQVVAALKGKGIKYIVFTRDFIGEDPFKYPFLKAKGLQRVIHSRALDLYLVL